MLAGLGVESEPSSGKEKTLTGGIHPSARERGREEEAGRAGDTGPGRRSWAARRERGSEARPTGPCGRRRKGRLGLGCKEEKKEEKEKKREEDGPGPK
jgi:hypothetical protein